MRATLLAAILAVTACGSRTDPDEYRNTDAAPVENTRYRRLADASAVQFVAACEAPGATRLLPSVDDRSTTATLPFDFRYWATDYPAGSPVNVSTNGWIGFVQPFQDSLSGSIPERTTPNGMIAVYWRDIVTSATGICAATIGTAPDRRWVLEWRNANHYSQTNSLTFELILHERTQAIDFVYGTLTGPLVMTAGLEDQQGMQAVSACTEASARCNPRSNERVRFVPIP